MRSHLLILSLFLGLGCNTVDPEDCRVNTSGGSGGSGTIPIGAGVGVTSGGDRAEPGTEPQDAEGGEQNNPCTLFADPPPLKPLEPGQAVCVVTWDRDSVICRSQNGGPPMDHDCTTPHTTHSKHVTEQGAVVACNDVHGIPGGKPGFPPGAKSCTCVLVK